MDDTVTLIVHASLIIVACEFAWGAHYPSADSWGFAGPAFLVSYLLCLISEGLGLKDNAFIKSSFFRNLLSLFHGLDGVSALIAGVSLYMRSWPLLLISLIVITKFFLIHILNRMILANKPSGDWIQNVTQTTKSYLHHVASFLFVTQHEEIILTTIWRTISMSGHAMLVLRGHVEKEKLQELSWALSHLRNLFLILLLGLFWVRTDIRMQFGRSAIGHIAYLAVRTGPVFKLGSIYLEGEEKELWQKTSALQRLSLLCSGHHPYLALELVLMLALIASFAYMRAFIAYTDYLGVSNSRL
jgi:hypothetical protein